MIDNHIDNGWISILQQFEIQSFNFLSHLKMIDKPSKGLDKWFFVLRNVLLLRCRPERNAKHSNKQRYKQKIQVL